MANVTVPATGEQLLKDTIEGGTVFPAGGLMFGSAGSLQRVGIATGLPVQFDNSTKQIFGDRSETPADSASTTNRGVIGLLKGLLQQMIEFNATVGGSLQASGNFVESPSLDVKFVPINAATAGAHTLVAGVSGKKIRVVNINMIAAGDVNATLRSGTNPITGAYPLAAQAGFSAHGGAFGVCETASGQSLTLNLSAAVQVSGVLAYLEV